MCAKKAQPMREKIVAPTLREEPRDENEVDFEGPNDLTQARNWKPPKKWSMITVLAFMTFISTLASTMFAPSIPAVMIDFKSQSSTLATLVVSIYVLGNAIGPLILAPLSELYGRAPVYHTTNILFVVFTAACALSCSMPMLIVFRFLAGAVGAAVLSIGGGTITDLFVPEERGRAMALWSLGPLLGPVVGPVVGGFVADALGWRWIFWILTILSGLTAILYLFFVPESYSMAILEKKSRHLRKSTGNSNFRSILSSPYSPGTTLFIALLRPCRMLLFSPVVSLISISMAVVFGKLYLLYTTITFVFEAQYNFSHKFTGLSFLGLGVGMFVGVGVFGAVSDRKMMSRANESEGGELKPEYRLPIMFYGITLISMGFFIYGWTAENHIMWIVPIIGTFFVGTGLMATFTPTQAYLVDAFPDHSASAMAASTLLRSIGGAFIPLVGPPMYASLGLGWGNSLLGFITIALIPVPVFLILYGEKMRRSYTN